MFYQHLSWVAQPSIQTLNRYYEPPDADGVPGIDVEPVVRDAEVIEMLNLMCLAVIAVFLGVGDLLGQDNSPSGTIEAEFKTLAERSSQDELTMCWPLHRENDVGRDRRPVSADARPAAAQSAAAL